MNSMRIAGLLVALSSIQTHSVTEPVMAACIEHDIACLPIIAAQAGPPDLIGSIKIREVNEFRILFDKYGVLDKPDTDRLLLQWSDTNACAIFDRFSANELRQIITLLQQA